MCLYSFKVTFGLGALLSLLGSLGDCGSKHSNLWDSSDSMVFIPIYLMFTNTCVY